MKQVVEEEIHVETKTDAADVFTETEAATIGGQDHEKMMPPIEESIEEPTIGPKIFHTESTWKEISKKSQERVEEIASQNEERSERIVWGSVQDVQLPKKEEYEREFHKDLTQETELSPLQESQRLSEEFQEKDEIVAPSQEATTVCRLL